MDLGHFISIGEGVRIRNPSDGGVSLAGFSGRSKKENTRSRGKGIFCRGISSWTFMFPAAGSLDSKFLGPASSSSRSLRSGG